MSNSGRAMSGILWRLTGKSKENLVTGPVSYPVAESIEYLEMGDDFYYLVSGHSFRTCCFGVSDSPKEYNICFCNVTEPPT